jgi:hypothetical protein
MKRRILSALALASAMAAVAYAQKVTTDSAPGAQFANYRTYAWTPGTPSPVSITEQRIHQDVNTQLQAKGLAQVDANPDLYVATNVTRQTVPELISNGFGPWWGYGSGFATVQTYTKGTLIVDLYDAGTKKMVWRGVATATLSDKPSKNTSKLDKALTKMFQRYPPRIASAND